MKKIFLCFTISMILFSCRKSLESSKAITGSNDINVKFENGRLKFATKTDYGNLFNLENVTSFINSLPGINSFNNFTGRKLSQGRSVSCFMSDDVLEENPDFFATLDENGIVQINHYLYRYDYCNDKVFVMSIDYQEDIGYFNDFLNGTEVKDVIGSFPTYVDVIEAVEGGYATMPDPTTVAENEIFEEISNSFGEFPGFEKFYFSNTSPTVLDQLMDGKMAYFKGGIYFHFYGKEKHQTPCAFGWCTTGNGPRDWNVTYNYAYRRKGSSNTVSGSGTLSPIYNNENKVDKTFYDGSRGLRDGYNNATWNVNNVYTKKVLLKRGANNIIWYTIFDYTMSQFSYISNYNTATGAQRFQMVF